jgi:hypothetical protein
MNRKLETLTLSIGLFFLLIGCAEKRKDVDQAAAGEWPVKSIFEAYEHDEIYDVPGGHIDFKALFDVLRVELPKGTTYEELKAYFLEKQKEFPQWCVFEFDDDEQIAVFRFVTMIAKDESQPYHSEYEMFFDFKGEQYFVDALWERSMEFSSNFFGLPGTSVRPDRTALHLYKEGRRGYEPN